VAESLGNSSKAAPAIVAFPDAQVAEGNAKYRLIKDLWAFDRNFIAVRFQYEWHDDAGQWFPLLRQ